MERALFLTLCAVLLSAASAKTYFSEKFDATWEKRWQTSTWKQDEGSAEKFELSAGPFYGDAEEDKGLRTPTDARFYATYAEFTPFSNEGKDLVLQFQVRHAQDLDCGGGYIKLLPASSGATMKDFGGDTPYSIMFGPDICGYSTRRVHVIFTYEGKNYLIKKTVPCKTDRLSHVYTLVVHPDNTYEVLIDLEKVESGSLEEDWEMLPPKTIKDPEATKPEDWDERAKIPDPEDVKPEGYDDIPATIVDPDATKPEDWNDEEDGEWEAPEIPNPDFKGEWKQKMIDNPDYKGKWEAPEIDNPEFKPNPKLYLYPDSSFVGFELWQVKAGSVFDNIIVTDSLDEAKEFAEGTWGKTKDAEKAMFDAQEEERKAKEEEERKAAGEEKDGEDEEEEDYEDMGAPEEPEAEEDDSKDEL